MIARFLVPTPARIAESLDLSRLTGTGGLTESGLPESSPGSFSGEVETFPAHS